MSDIRDPSESGAAPPGRGLLALMVAVLYIALVVFTWGVMSFALDRDVIEIADAGPLVGPLMVAVSAGLVFLLVVRARADHRLRGAAFAALAALVVAPFVGAMALSLGSGALMAFPVYLGSFVLSPFTLAAALIAAVLVTVAPLVGGGSR